MKNIIAYTNGELCIHRILEIGDTIKHPIKIFLHEDGRLVQKDYKLNQKESVPSVAEYIRRHLKKSV